MLEWKDGNRVQIDPPKRPKKLTGTRFAAVLGLNKWSTPFEIWCAVTRTYEKPFEDTVYTIAGKTIEPKQAEYMRNAYMMTNLITPTDVFGADYFKKTYGDFFADRNVLGGMWDYLLTDKEGKPTAVLEMKTSKRVEDWAEDIPEYYALQAALYAYLLGVEKVIMVASFLEDKDYTDPNTFVCSGANTITRQFNLHKRYPHFEREYVNPVMKWWEDYVETGLSPEYDEKKDAEILQALRTNNLSPETDMSALIAEAEQLKMQLDSHAAEVAVAEKRYKQLVDMIKKSAIEQFRDGDTKVSIPGSNFTWEVSRSVTPKVNKKAMQEDGIWEKYTTAENTYRISPKIIKKGE